MIDGGNASVEGRPTCQPAAARRRIVVHHFNAESDKPMQVRPTDPNWVDVISSIAAAA